MANIEISRILTEANLKVTPQRCTILEIISEADNHPDIDQIFKLTRFYHPNISPTTVYNTLKLFQQKGLLKKIVGADNRIRFDPVTLKHHHIFNTETHKIEDFIDEELDSLLQSYFTRKKIPSYKIESFTLQINAKPVKKTN